jgi:hypothetical protein
MLLAGLVEIRFCKYQVWLPVFLTVNGFDPSKSNFVSDRFLSHN